MVRVLYLMFVRLTSWMVALGPLGGVEARRIAGPAPVLCQGADGDRCNAGSTRSGACT